MKENKALHYRFRTRFRSRFRPWVRTDASIIFTRQSWRAARRLLRLSLAATFGLLCCAVILFNAQAQGEAELHAGTETPAGEGTVVQRISLPIIINQSTLPRILNGDFEEFPNSSWSEASSNGASLIVDFSLLPNSVQTHSGLYVAWLGGIPNESSALAQTVHLPVRNGDLKLRYWYWIASEETNCTDDLAIVQARSANNGVQMTLNSHTLCRTTATSGWSQACIDMGAWAGHTTTFQFVTALDGSKNSNFFVDDVSPGNSCGGG